MHLNDAELAGIEREFILPDQLNAPVQEGQKVGEVIIKLRDNTIGICELYAGENVPFWTVDMNIKKIFEQWINMRELFITAAI